MYRIMLSSGHGTLEIGHASTIELASDLRSACAAVYGLGRVYVKRIGG